MRIEHFCKNCGKQLADNERPCPRCGGSFRHDYAYLEDNISSPDESIRGKLKRPGIPGNAYELIQKKKISCKTKRPAKETIIIDRTHPKKTVKNHKVWESNGEKWVLRHDERIVSKAKHRKKNVND